MSNKGNTFRQTGNSVSGKRAPQKESTTFKKEKSQKIVYQEIILMHSKRLSRY
jgi:hypothetical protein